MIYLFILNLMAGLGAAEPQIDLRSHARLLYNLSSTGSPQPWPRLYSSQLTDQQLNTHFRINHSSIELRRNTSRPALCASLNSCFHGNQDKCVLGLNLLVYLKNETKSSFNEIKLIKLSVVLSDWSRDFLLFDRPQYSFVFDVGQESDGHVHPLGSVSASTLLNQDLNQMVRYYAEFGPADKLDLVDLIRLDEHTGLFTVNRTKLLSHKYGQEYVVQVNAVIKCSQNHKALHNHTAVRLRFVDSSRDRPVLNLLSLVEQKSLTNRDSCLMVSQRDLINSRRIALAQLQIDNFNFSQSYRFKISQTNKFDIKIEHLIDNLFVVYLLNTNATEFFFLSELHQIDFKLSSSRGSIYSHFCVCVNVRTQQQLHEELSLVKFAHNLVVVAAERSWTVLQVDSVGHFNFVLDPTFNQFSFRLEKLSASSVNISLHTADPLFTHHEALVLAYHANTPLTHFLKSYAYLKQIALEHKKFLTFSAKVIFRRDNFAFNINQFYPRQKIVGYLAPVENLVPRAHLLNFGNAIENYFYVLNSSGCVQIRKFSGLIVSSKKCVTNSSLSVSLNNVDREYNLEDIVSIDLAAEDGHIFVPIVLHINSSVATNEFNLNFDVNLNHIGQIDQHQIELVRMVSDKDDTLYYTRGERPPVFSLDSKLGSISLNLSHFYQHTSLGVFNKCFLVEVMSKSYEYSSPTRRTIKSSDLIDVNICLSSNSQQDTFLRGELTSGFGFQFLRAQNITRSVAFVAFLGMFLTTSFLLLGIIVYMYGSSRLRKKMAKQCSGSSECKLRIRNDELYESVELGMVPSKLDVLLNKKPISPDAGRFAEVSSVKEVSEDQGVYCVATGTSFTSNVSSTSDCFDSVSNCSVLNGQEVVLGVEKMSLFDLTPMPKQQVYKTVNTELTREICGINEWLQSSKDNRLVVASSQANFSFDTQTSTISSNECII